MTAGFINTFRGTGVALITPMFPDGTVDIEAFKKLVEKNIAGGVEYLVVLGTTGEAITLSTKECRFVMDTAMEVANGRVPIVAGHFGGNETIKLVNRINDYNFDGLDAVLSSNPAYNKPSQEGIYQHYMRVADASPKPVIIYNVPGRTASNIEAETILRLAESHENFLGVKEASGDMVQASQIIKHVKDDFLVMSGDDPTAMLMCALGGQGVISVIANMYPKIFSEMIRFSLKHDFVEARKLHNLVLDIHPWLYAEGNPVGIKGALQIQGIMESRKARFPLVQCSDSIIEGLKKEMAKIESTKNDL